MMRDSALKRQSDTESHSGLPLRTVADPPRRDRVSLFEALASGGIAVGSIVQSLAGHDYSRIALVIALRPPFAQIVDGRYRSVGKPKVKRLAHLRPIARANLEELNEALALPDEGQQNSAIRRLIRQNLPLTEAGKDRTGNPVADPDHNP